MGKTATENGGELAERPERAPLAIGRAGIHVHDIDQLWRFADMVAKSKLVPKGMERPEQVAVAMELGMELGIPLLRAVQSIAVINGQPSLWGDMPLALCEASGLVDDYSEEWSGTGDDYGCRVIAKRRGRSKPSVRRFTVANAKTASLWGKSGPWSQYPDQMLMYRARSFALRAAFADVLAGIAIKEEYIDVVTEPSKPVDLDAMPDGKKRPFGEFSITTTVKPAAESQDDTLIRKTVPRETPAKPAPDDPAPADEPAAVGNDFAGAVVVWRRATKRNPDAVEALREKYDLKIINKAALGNMPPKDYLDWLDAISDLASEPAATPA